jgi:hypothetical protein
MKKILKKPSDGERMPDTPDMIAWRKEFEEIDLDTHKKMLRSLGLDDEELEEFEEMEKKGIPLEEELLSEKQEEKINKNKKVKTIKKKVIKK